MRSSPAANGGIREGDIITRFNGDPIELSAELPHLVGRAPAGSEAVMDIVREGRKITLTMTIGELADDGEGTAAPSQPGAGGSSRLGLSVEPVPDPARERLGIDGGVRVVDVSGAAQDAVTFT